MQSKRWDLVVCHSIQICDLNLMMILLSWERKKERKKKSILPTKKRRKEKFDKCLSSFTNSLERANFDSIFFMQKYLVCQIRFGTQVHIVTFWIVICKIGDLEIAWLVCYKIKFIDTLLLGKDFKIPSINKKMAIFFYL